MVRERVRVQKFFSKPSLTRQEFKDEVDLGKIVAKFGRTPEGMKALNDMRANSGGLFQDVSNIPDFRTSRDLIIKANESFMQLPAIVRRRFNNDSAEFVDFATNPNNLDELRKMGLAKPLPAESPVNPAVVAGTTPAG